MSDVIFYSAEQDPDRLMFEDVSEAVMDVVDQWDEAPTPDDTIEVTSYKFKTLPSRERIAEWLIEDTKDWLASDYADPDGFDDELYPSDVQPEALALADAIRKHYRVWSCERVNTWTERVANHVPDGWIEERQR
jgi:hypothetical protein